MKTFKSKQAMPRYAALAAVLAAGSVLPSLAEASTAANATVRNIVTVNFADANNNPQAPVLAAVDVSVTLVAVNPSLANPVTAQTIAPNQTANYTVTVTNNSNGPENFALAMSGLTESAGLSGSTAVFSPATPLVVGGTTVASLDGAWTGTSGIIYVPSDGTNDSSVNGISTTAGFNTVDINGVSCTVTAVNDTDAPVSSTAQFTDASLTVTCTAAVTPTAGMQVKGVRDVVVTHDPGTYTGPGPQTVSATLNVTGVTAVAIQAAHTTTVVGPDITVTKYVRNATTDAPGAGAAVTFPGAITGNFYASGVSAVPTNVLEYVIVVSNGALGSVANLVDIADPIPPFTTLGGTNQGLFDATGVSLGACDQTTNNGNLCELIGSTTAGTLHFYPGGDDNVNAGTLAPGATVYARFQVTVN